MRRHRAPVALVALAVLVTVLPGVASAAFQPPSTPQAGLVTVDEDWARVDFPAEVVDPVVAVGPATRRGNQQLTVRVRNVSRTGFEVRLEEWPYLDGQHVDEEVAWLAVTRGVTTLASGVVLQSGRFPARTGWRAVGLHETAPGQPVVLATAYDGDLDRPVAPRLRGLDGDGFDLRFQAQEAGPTGAETQGIGWIAVAAPPGAVPTVGDPFTWAIGGGSARHTNTTIAVSGSPAEPCVLGGLQTFAGSDTAMLRLVDADASGVVVRVEEEASRDAELGHVAEDVGLVLLGCTAPPPAPPPPPVGEVAHVVHVSIDGLRPDAIALLGADDLPNLHRLVAEGASTMDARADADLTKTLPNHLSQLTGRPVLGPDGHQVIANQDAGVTTVHDAAGTYVASVFDVVHDHGFATGLFAGKDKFNAVDRSWNEVAGAPDTTGADDGRDKIDRYLKADTATLVAAWQADMTTAPYAFSLLHVRDTDVAGHADGWMTAPYFDALRAADAWLGEVLATIESTPALAGSTAVVVTSDHGGDVLDHADAALEVNYTTPLFAWAPGVVAAGADLYALNATTHLHPGDGRPPRDASPPPIRGHVAANLALDLLGLPPIPGSVVNADHALAVG